MKIDSLPQVGHVLRSFVGNPGNVILKDQESRKVLLGGFLLLHVNDSAVGDASNLIKPFPAHGFQFFRSLRLLAKNKITGEYRGKAACGKCI